MAIERISENPIKPLIHRYLEGGLFYFSFFFLFHPKTNFVYHLMLSVSSR